MEKILNKSELLRQEIAQLVEKYAEGKYKPTVFEPGITSIPPSGKVLGKEELLNMVEASLDGWLTTGRFNEKFEKKLADFLGR